MEQRPSDVQIPLAATMQDEECRDVYCKTEEGNYQHYPAEHLDGLEHAAQGFDHNPRGNADQSRAIQKGGQNLETVVTVRA